MGSSIDTERTMKNLDSNDIMSYYDEGDLSVLLKDINLFYGKDILK